MSRFQTLGWNSTRLTRVAQRGLPNTTIAEGAQYPFRVLRYWFMHELMLAAARERPWKLAVAEIGVDHGQQLAFANWAVTEEEPVWWTRWDGFDCAPRTDLLAQIGYTDTITVDIDKPEAARAFEGRTYDVVVACHVLEHLFDPESAVVRMRSLVKPGGLLIGGGPVMPDVAAGSWQSRLRQRAKPYGHVSVLSPARLARMAMLAELEPEWQAGAFMLRRHGLALEQQRWWLQFNLAFGALFPGWPGEIYFAWRRPSTEGQADMASDVRPGEGAWARRT
jgi:SAM-dependent methyltransferase